jgi:hypothetical protein
MKYLNKNIELRKIFRWTWKIASSKAFIGSLLLLFLFGHTQN